MDCLFVHYWISVDVTEEFPDEMVEQFVMEPGGLHSGLAVAEVNKAHAVVKKADEWLRKAIDLVSQSQIAMPRSNANRGRSMGRR